MFLTAGIFAAGVAFWFAGTISTRDATVGFARAVGVEDSAVK